MLRGFGVFVAICLMLICPAANHAQAAPARETKDKFILTADGLRVFCEPTQEEFYSMGIQYTKGIKMVLYFDQELSEPIIGWAYEKSLRLHKHLEYADPTKVIPIPETFFK